MTPLSDRAELARAITLMESTRADHREQAEALLQSVLPLTGRSLRIGISGVPGVGKSTFIETFGQYVIGQGHKLAVLAVDPSSQRTGGSILGDKTRMEKLANHPSAFVRPSPTGGALGGVARHTREAILLCEAAGYDVVIVETVGVGQSETDVADMVDIFMLMLLPSGGDELQGIKRGIMELADLIVVNKADGDMVAAANRARSDYEAALRLMQPPTPGTTPVVLLCSALHHTGIADVWEHMTRFQSKTQKTGEFSRKRVRQGKVWMRNEIDASLKAVFDQSPAVQAHLPVMLKALEEQKVTPGQAARELVMVFRKEKS